jgi:hypothetical protein
VQGEQSYIKDEDAAAASSAGLVWLDVPNKVE